MMRTIYIDPRILPRGYYAAHVAAHGHEPGVLSGAELRGRARRYGGWYQRQRERVARSLADLGIQSRLLLHPTARRLARVWVTEAGEPVRITLD